LISVLLAIRTARSTRHGPPVMRTCRIEPAGVVICRIWPTSSGVRRTVDAYNTSNIRLIGRRVVAGLISAFGTLLVTDSFCVEVPVAVFASNM
jgi:hypothetical protein